MPCYVPCPVVPIQHGEQVSPGVCAASPAACAPVSLPAPSASSKQPAWLSARSTPRAGPRERPP
eukprot:1737593-Pyramimonas_sp.AAC.1